MQERQFPPFDVESRFGAEHAARRRARAWQARGLLAALGVSVLSLFAIGCPEPGDLQNAGVYQAPTPSAGTSSGGTASSGGGGGTATGDGSQCESACMATLINATGTGCKSCHGTTIKLAGTLDFETKGYTARLKDKPAEHAGVKADAVCPSGDKLVDTATPANSWLLKKLSKDQTGTCGDPMPLGSTASAADVMCVQTYVNCVAGGGTTTPPAGGSASTAGASSGGSATSGSGGTGGT